MIADPARSRLVGYVRKDVGKGKLRISLSVEAIAEAQRFKAGDGRDFVSFYCNLERVNQVINGDREVTSIVELVEVSE